MLDRLGSSLFDRHDPAAVLHAALTQELVVSETGARLRLSLPFARKGDVSLKKIGLELIVRVDGQKRTIMLPPAMAAFGPARQRSRQGRWRSASMAEGPKPTPARYAGLEQRLDRAARGRRAPARRRGGRRPGRRGR